MRRNAKRLAAAGLLRLGRKTYELFKGCWPPMADHPQATTGLAR
jgi:dihydrofolate reductase